MLLLTFLNFQSLCMSHLHLWISPGDSCSFTTASVRLQVHHEEFFSIIFRMPYSQFRIPRNSRTLPWPRQRPRKDMPKPNHLLRSHLGRISLHTPALCRPHRGYFISAEVKLTRQSTNLHFLRTLLAVLAGGSPERIISGAFFIEKVLNFS